MNILVFGDIFGRPGREAMARWAQQLRREYAADLVVANIENASGGAGVTERNARELTELGSIDVFTSGNHIFDQKDVNNFLQSCERVIRPANYPEPCPGRGYVTLRINGIRVSVVNISGVVFMRETLDNPFKCFDRLHEILSRTSDIIVVDFHADATSEKIAFGYHADGRAQVVFGTHTHVQTADERILAGGCGYITDVGMCGPYDGVIGVSRDGVIKQFVTQRHTRFEVAEGSAQINGACFSLDDTALRCVNVERVRRILD